MKLATTIGAMVVAAALGASAPAMGQGCVSWEEGTSVAQPEFETAAMCYDTQRDVMYVYGHVLQRGEQWWRFDGMHWTQLNPPFHGSYLPYVSLAYDSGRDRVVAYVGGYSCEYDPAAGTWWRQIQQPAVRPHPGAQMAYDEARGVTVAYGGNFTSIFEWDGQAWTEATTAGPSVREWPEVAYDPSRGVTLIVGGSASGGMLRETWEWDGTTATLRTTASPEVYGRQAALAYDRGNGRAVLVSDYARQVWFWDSADGTWTQVIDGGPGVSEFGSTFDERTGHMIMVGGRVNSVPRPGVYTLVTGAAAFVQQPRGGQITPGQPLVLGAVVNGDVVSYRWLKDGVEIPGSNTPVLVIAAPTAEDAGSYVLEAVGPCATAASDPAEVTYRCTADTDGNGVLTLSDFVQFRNAYTAGCP